jgi:hypothetical protein
MLKKIYLFNLIFISIITYGQVQEKFSISGSVISINSNNPISFGTIRFTKNNGTNCDCLGNFNILNLTKGKYVLQFSALGYPSKDTIIFVDRNIADLKLNIYTDCSSGSFNANSARQDIANGQPKLLLIGSVAPLVYKKDNKFAKKYNIRFFDFGCTPDYNECIDAYSKIIFEYLDKKFGLKWRREVRKDIVGL